MLWARTEHHWPHNRAASSALPSNCLHVQGNPWDGEPALSPKELKTTPRHIDESRTIYACQQAIKVTTWFLGCLRMAHLWPRSQTTRGWRPPRARSQCAQSAASPALPHSCPTAAPARVRAHEASCRCVYYSYTALNYGATPFDPDVFHAAPATRNDIMHRTSVVPSAARWGIVLFVVSWPATHLVHTQRAHGLLMHSAPWRHPSRRAHAGGPAQSAPHAPGACGP